MQVQLQKKVHGLGAWDAFSPHIDISLAIEAGAGEIFEQYSALIIIITSGQDFDDVAFNSIAHARGHALCRIFHNIVQGIAQLD